MKSHVTLPSIDNPSYMDYPPPFLEDHEPSPFYVFQKSQPPTPLYIRVGESYSTCKPKYKKANIQ